VALGYLSGLVDGPIVAVIAGLGLMVLGRSLQLGRPADAVAAVALGILVAALGVGALAWRTLELGAIRGAQGVLGPTVLVEPREAATAAWLAAGAGALCLALWWGLDVARRRPDRLPEVGVGAMALVTTSWGPTPAGEVAIALQWMAGIAAFIVIAVGVGELVARLPQWATAVISTIAAGSVTAGVVLVSTAL
jgi:hypothetical protein